MGSQSLGQIRSYPRNVHVSYFAYLAATASSYAHPVISRTSSPTTTRDFAVSTSAQRRSRERRVPCGAYLEELSSWRRSIWVWLGRVRNNDILLTEHMEVLATRIMEHGNGLPEGTPVVAKELLHLGSRAAVDQALSRLVRRGTLMRAGRGIYV